MADTAGCIVRALALAFVCLAAAGERAAAQPDTFHGSATVRVTDDAMTFGNFDWPRFPAFAEESLARYYKLGGKVKVELRSGADSTLHDIELRGPSSCLAPEISRSGWQKLRFEFGYKIDAALFASARRERYEFFVRFVSGHVADYQQDQEPPPERYKQISPAELTDLANKLAGSMRRELSRTCFDKQNLKYCETTVAGPCS